MTQIKVATANTFLGQASRDIESLSKLLKSDVLLLQEVLNPVKHHVAKQLESLGYEVLVLEGRFGLTIAIRRDSGLRMVGNSLRMCSFAKLSTYERLLLRVLVKGNHELRERGMVAVKLVTRDSRQLTVVNVHPGVSFPSGRKRKKQIATLSLELQDPYYQGALIVAGDMNHYPAPKAEDLKLLEQNNLTPVDLGGHPTWKILGSSYEKLARFAIIFNRRAIESYNAQLDAVLYRKQFLKSVKSELIMINSDHQAILSTFMFKTEK